MIEIFTVCAMAALLAFAGRASAEGLPVPQQTSVPKSGFFAGVGGSYNWTRFDQSLKGVSGVTDIMLGPDLFAEGQAGGPAAVFNRNDSGAAFDAQLGYMRSFAASDWAWGAKFAYKYQNLTSNERVSVPQSGSFTTLDPVETVSFTGFVPIRSAQIALKHQLAFMPTLGRSFGKVFVYAGGGPALFGTETKFLDAKCYAVIGGNLVNVCGTTFSYSTEDWVWGGAAQVGATYALGSRWFLDLAYMFARSEEFAVKYSTSFSHQDGPLTTSGSANLIAHQQITNQSVVLTLNRMF
jgi:hypothetical protein